MYAGHLLLPPPIAAVAARAPRSPTQNSQNIPYHIPSPPPLSRGCPATSCARATWHFIESCNPPSPPPTPVTRTLPTTTAVAAVAAGLTLQTHTHNTLKVFGEGATRRAQRATNGNRPSHVLPLYERTCLGPPRSGTAPPRRGGGRGRGVLRHTWRAGNPASRRVRAGHRIVSYRIASYRIACRVRTWLARGE